jgi:hypothetical protein
LRLKLDWLCQAWSNVAMTFAKGVFAMLGIFASIIFNPSFASTIRDDQPDSGYVDLGADWVLTAAHNLTAASSGTFTIGGVSYASNQLISNPGWTGNAFGGYDFGLVHLSSPVVGVTPATLYTGSSEVGQVGTYVGYGFTGTGLTGWQTFDGQKRAFQNAVDGDFGNPAILLASDFDNPHSAADNGFGSATPLLLEGAVAPGDSGGGVFITINSQT